MKRIEEVRAWWNRRTLRFRLALWYAVGALKWAWRWMRTHHEITSRAAGGVVEVSAKLGDHLATSERRDPSKAPRSSNGGSLIFPKDPAASAEGPLS